MEYLKILPIYFDILNESLNQLLNAFLFQLWINSKMRYFKYLLLCIFSTLNVISFIIFKLIFFHL